jgi:hypothetical protein
LIATLMNQQQMGAIDLFNPWSDVIYYPVRQ